MVTPAAAAAAQAELEASNQRKLAQGSSRERRLKIVQMISRWNTEI